PAQPPPLPDHRPRPSGADPSSARRLRPARDADRGRLSPPARATGARCGPDGGADVMIELPKAKMTADQFLVWLEGPAAEAGKFELWDGEVVVRHGPGFEESELAEHWDAKGAIYRALHEAIKRAGQPCFAAVDGPMVRLSPYRMARPDVLVYCGP